MCQGCGVTGTSVAPKLNNAIIAGPCRAPTDIGSSMCVGVLRPKGRKKRAPLFASDIDICCHKGLVGKAMFSRGCAKSLSARMRIPARFTLRTGRASKLVMN